MCALTISLKHWPVPTKRYVPSVLLVGSHCYNWASSISESWQFTSSSPQLRYGGVHIHIWGRSTHATNWSRSHVNFGICYPAFTSTHCQSQEMKLEFMLSYSQTCSVNSAIRFILQHTINWTIFMSHVRFKYDEKYPHVLMYMYTSTITKQHAMWAATHLEAKAHHSDTWEKSCSGSSPPPGGLELAIADMSF